MVGIYSEIVSEGVQHPWLWQRQTFILCSWARNTEDRDFIIGQQTRDLYSHDGRSDSVSLEGFYINATFYKLLHHCQWSRINTDNFHPVIFFPFFNGSTKRKPSLLRKAWVRCFQATVQHTICHTVNFRVRVNLTKPVRNIS